MVTAMDKLLVHLRRYPSEKYSDGLAPYEITQMGIAQSIGVTRNYVAVLIGRAIKMENPLIFYKTRRVKGSTKKKKVYFLTNHGVQRAKEIISKYENRKIVLVLQDGRRDEIYLKDISSYTHKMIDVISGILLLDKNNKIIVQTDIMNKGVKKIIGRHNHLNMLRGFLLSASGGKGICTLISGEKGVGKTHLSEYVMNMAEEMGFIIFRANGYKDISVPYLTILTIFNSSKLIREVKEINELIDRMIRNSGEKCKDLKESQRLMWHHIVNHIKRLSLKRPILFFIDDIQWVDQQSLKMLVFLCIRLKDHRVFFLITKQYGWFGNADRELSDSIASIHPKILELKPLSRNETKEFVSLLIGIEKDIPKKFVNMIFRVSRGNPYFIEKIIEGMIQNGSLIPSKNIYPEYVGADCIPESASNYIHSRISQLDYDEREMLYWASVIGERTSYSFLKAILGYDEKKFINIFQSLVEKGFLNSNEKDIVFSHPIIRLAVYGMLQNRHAWHRFVVNKIEELKRGGIDISDIDMGYHYLEGGMVNESLDYYLRMAEKSRKNLDFKRYLSFLESAYSIASKYGMIEKLKGIVKDLGILYVSKGNFNRAIEIYDGFLNMGDNDEEMATIYGLLADAYRDSGDLQEALNIIERGLSITYKDATNSIGLLSRKMWLLLKMGKIKESLNILKIMETLAEKSNDKVIIAKVLEDRATIKWYLGDYVKAKKYLEKAIEINEMEGNNPDLAVLYTNMGILLAEQGMLTKAITYFRLSKDIDERLGNIIGLAKCYMNLGIIYRKKGMLNKAIKHFQKSLSIEKDIGNRDSVGIALFNLGNTYLLIGEFDNAIKYISDSLEIFRELNFKVGLCYALLSKGEIMMYRGLNTNAEKLIWEGIKMAEEIKNKEALVEGYLLLSRFYMMNKFVPQHIKFLPRLNKLVEYEHKKNLIYLKSKYALGILKFAAKESDDAINMIGDVVMGFRKMRDYIDYARSLFDLGVMQINSGMTNEGNANVKKACNLFKKMNMKFWIEKCKKIECK